MDGLLIDSERIIMRACIQAAKDIGIDYTQQEFVELIGRAGQDSTRIMTEQLGGVEQFNHVMHGLDALLAKRKNTFPLQPGVKALLEHYKINDVICSVASSSSSHHIEERLSNVGVRHYFEGVTSGQDVACGKPSPDIYLLAIQKLRLDAEDCIAFEDSEMGARAAIAAGLKVVVVPDLKQPSHFVRNNCYRTVPSLEHFLNTL